MQVFFFMEQSTEVVDICFLSWKFAIELEFPAMYVTVCLFAHLFGNNKCVALPWVINTRIMPWFMYHKTNELKLSIQSMLHIDCLLKKCDPPYVSSSFHFLGAVWGEHHPISSDFPTRQFWWREEVDVPGRKHRGGGFSSRRLMDSCRSL